MPASLTRLFRAFAARAVAVVTAGALLAGCNGGGASAPAFSTGTASAGTVQRTGKLVLPPGSPINATTLTISNSLGNGTIAADGTYRMPVFPGGPQFASVTDSGGNLVMVAFLSDAEPDASAHSTAETFLYYALGAYSLGGSDQIAFVASIGTYPGEAAVESAISAALRSGAADPLQANGAAIKAAIAAFQAAQTKNPPISSSLGRISSVRAASGTRRPRGLSVDPSGQVSGLTMLLDFPNSVHFRNVYRRAAEVYVDEISPNQTSLSASPLYQIDAITPIAGFNSTLVNIINGKFAFSEIETAPISLPAEPLAAQTIYQLTVVGPGLPTGSPLSSTRDQEQIAFDTAFYCQNVLYPLIVSVILPLNKDAIDASLVKGATSQFRDMAKIVQSSPAVAAAVKKGDMLGIVRALGAVLSTTAVRDAVVGEGLKLYKVFGPGTGFLTAAEKVDAKVITTLLTKIDVVLSSADILAVAYSVGNSNSVDVFTVTVIPETVTLTPPASTIQNGNIVDFTATAVNAANHSSSQTISYKWTNVPPSGTTLSGHLTDAVNGHLDNYTSNSAISSYTANATGQGTDVISVTVMVFDNTTGKTTTVGTASATVTVGGGQTSIAPSLPVVSGGTATPFTATAPALSAATGYEFHWSSTAAGGSLASASGTTTFVDTTAQPTDTVTYNALIGPNADSVSVDVIAKTPAGNIDLGPATTTVTVKRPSIVITPPSTVANGAKTTYAVTFPAGPDPNTTLSYTWSNTASVGHISDGAGHTDNFTSSAASVTYTANATGAGSDTISVHVQATLGTRSADLSTLSTTATILSPSPSPAPPDLAGWLGAFTCPINPNQVNPVFPADTVFTLTFSVAPFDAKFGPPPPGTNLLGVVTNNKNAGTSYNFLFATATKAIDSRALTDPTYTTTYFLSGHNITGSPPAPCF